MLSIIFTLIQLFAFTLTFNAKSEHYLTEQINYNNTGINCDYNDNTSETNIVINSQNCDELNNLKETKISLTLKEASQTTSFYLLLITFALGSQPSYFINLNKSFGETFIDDDQYLALVTSISFVTNAIGGVFWGHLFDYLGFKVSD